MDSKALTAAVRLRQWSGIIAQRRESGQTVRTWCRENGVAEKTCFYYYNIVVGRARQPAVALFHFIA